MGMMVRFMVAKILLRTGWPRIYRSGSSGILRIASGRWPRALGAFQDEGAAVSEIGFRCFPSGTDALVPEFWRARSGFVIVGWNPSADGLPGRFDGLEGLIRPPCMAGSREGAKGLRGGGVNRDGV
jgi:hypothetical protein